MDCKILVWKSGLYEQGGAYRVRHCAPGRTATSPLILIFSAWSLCAQLVCQPRILAADSVHQLYTVQANVCPAHQVGKTSSLIIYTFKASQHAAAYNFSLSFTWYFIIRLLVEVFCATEASHYYLLSVPSPLLMIEVQDPDRFCPQHLFPVELLLQEALKPDWEWQEVLFRLSSALAK